MICELSGCLLIQIHVSDGRYTHMNHHYVALFHLGYATCVTISSADVSELCREASLSFEDLQKSLQESVRQRAREAKGEAPHLSNWVPRTTENAVALPLRLCNLSIVIMAQAQKVTFPRNGITIVSDLHLSAKSVPNPCSRYQKRHSQLAWTLSASGGYVSFGAQTDLRIKTVATFSAVCAGEIIRHGFIKDTVDQAILLQQLKASEVARITENKSEVLVYAKYSWNTVRIQAKYFEG
ncbi:hypothetical protein K493DRAFT_301627 [Basidiobolus meristosporus CBS 931.73]|uniref:Uncharacterized protein n=1 Tax=Basidiobolus meristosporus CBS 931.73 TaxID=1314790 RepID=A0A1Y1YB37_9FUNG|nr:hypothetical protein K493DRAFT_301627 [Basidiobolus meristosporus CBS 931.73]|eukprot:ORX95198.1 hypothetical protein K493DRAFT_301627 [Basidiobolus meristosporus CBS 931.73]